MATDFLTRNTSRRRGMSIPAVLGGWLAGWVLGWPASVAAQELKLDERAARPGEWGDRPAEGSTVEINPPAFVWRPQPNATKYEWQAARAASFTIGVRTVQVKYPVHCPEEALGDGLWYWRFRSVTEKGNSAWSRTRKFTIPKDATPFAMPGRETIVARMPKTHPRLFLRPEELPALRKKVAEEWKESFAKLVARCEKVHEKPPSTDEPPKYPEGTVRLSEAWRTIWWGNRTATIGVLSAVADLAFVAAVTEDERHAKLAKKLLMAVAKWDPRGSTGFAYNDEAGMPYAYWFARSYTYLHSFLSKEERAECQAMMAVRGKDMYEHLAPRHLYRPYGSHDNRSWHFLGEVGIAFFGEIEAAEEWVWFASRVFGAVYPVWSDDDGGWHEGLAYWRSYLRRFTWWADVQKSAFGLDAYGKPFFSRVGDFVLYLQPPGTRGGGFGDQTGRLHSGSAAGLMQRFAQSADNGYWSWHAQKHEIPEESGFIGFLRGRQPAVPPKPPVDLPASKVFRGTGLAVLNSTLLDGKDNVQVLFKSSPFGTQSHGYEAQNSFLLYAFGERLLIRSGRRDVYGSEHHKKWMWSTRSTNSVTIDGGKGQGRRSAGAKGAIAAFSTGPVFDYVVGEAGEAYADLTRFTRRILFVKPDYIVIHDTLASETPRTYEWWLHSFEEMKLAERDPSAGQESSQGTEPIPNQVTVQKGDAACIVRWLVPEALSFAQTDEFDPPPRKRIKLRQHHLTATTGKPSKEMTFVTVLRPYRAASAAEVALETKVEPIEGGHRVTLDGSVVVELVGNRTTAKRGEATFDSEKPK